MLNKNNNTFIIHEQGKDKNLLFMYKPFVNTLFKLFPNSKFMYNKWKFSDFNKNDVVIAIGVAKVDSYFKQLKNKGVYIIFFWTEPCILEEKISKYCDEIYIYSRYLYHLQPKAFTNQKISFVPIMIQETTYFVNYLNKNDNLKLCFLGLLDVRDKDTVKILSEKKYFTSSYQLFKNSKYNKYITKNTNIYLNINKKRGLRTLSNILPYGRICKLLSHKCLIISEHCNKDDEELFKDIIYFCDIKDIDKTFYNLSIKTPKELYEISNEKYKKFCNIFNPNNDNLILTK